MALQKEIQTEKGTATYHMISLIVWRPLFNNTRIHIASFKDEKARRDGEPWMQTQGFFIDGINQAKLIEDYYVQDVKQKSEWLDAKDV